MHLKKKKKTDTGTQGNITPACLNYWDICAYILNV